MPGIKHPLTVELALLGLIRQQPLHPYELHQRLNQTEALGQVWHLKQAHLYALLRRLEAAGYVTSITEPQGSRPPRKILQITPAGETIFQHWLQTPVSHGRDLRLEFLAKLFFAHQEGLPVVTNLLARQRESCQQRLYALEAQLTALPTEQTYQRLVLQFRHGQLAAVLAWLATCSATLTSHVTSSR